MGYKYLFVIIDLFTRFVWVIPIKRKQGLEIRNVLQGLFKERRPDKFQSDEGTEFTNQNVRKLFNDYKINFFVTKNKDIKCAMAERFIRTLRAKLFRYFTQMNTKRYIDVLHKIVDGYNNTKHSSTKEKPVDIGTHNEKEVFKRLYGFESMRELLRSNFKKLSRKNDISVNSDVKLALRKSTFKRGYTKNWSDENSKIKRIIPKAGKQVYEIQTKNKVLSKKFYPEEIQVVYPDKLYIEKILKESERNGVQKIFVKWKDYPDSFNSWIPKADISPEDD